MTPRARDDKGSLVAFRPTTCVVRQRIIAVPHAGAGPNSVVSWSKIAPSDTELLLFRLPGRESRFSEAPHTDANRAAEELEKALMSLPPRPTVILGHSMGALIGFKAAQLLQQNGWGHLSGLVVSGLHTPDGGALCPSIHALPDDEFLSALTDLGGVPEELLAQLAHDSDMLDLLLPVVRTDFQLVDEYVHAAGPLLRCPIAAIAGQADPLAPPADMAGWADFTDVSFELITHTGHHFSVTENNGVWHRAVEAALAAVMPTPAPEHQL